MFNKKKQAIGIDVGSHFIKIVCLSYDDERVGFDKYIIQKTPNQMVQNGVIQYPDDLAEILQGILLEHDIKTKSASIAIPVGEEAGMLKWLDMPNLKPKEMKKALEENIEDEFHRTPNELYYNWHKVREKKEGKKEVAEMLMAAVTKTSMDSALTLLQKNKMKPYFGEIDVFSSVRTLIEDQKQIREENIAIIDLGATETLISIFNQGNYSYMRNLPYGGFQWISRVSDLQGLDMKEAEKQFIANAAISNRPEELPFEKQVIADLILEPVSDLVNEIEETFEFFQDYSKANIDKIILTGGGARMHGMSQFIEEKLNIPTQIGISHFAKNLPKKQQDILQPIWPSLHVAFGLALKEVQDYV